MTTRVRAPGDILYPYNTRIPYCARPSLHSVSYRRFRPDPRSWFLTKRNEGSYRGYGGRRRRRRRCHNRIYFWWRVGTFLWLWLNASTAGTGQINKTTAVGFRVRCVSRPRRTSLDGHHYYYVGTSNPTSIPMHNRLDMLLHYIILPTKRK